MKTNKLVGLFAAGAVIASLAACGGGTSSKATSGKTITADDAFDLKTSDPARAFEFTGTIVDHQIYQTTLDYDGPNLKKIVPGICSFTMADHDKVLTLKIQGKHTFSDGSPVTVDDIVFSYQRVQGIKGNPSFLLDGVTVKKVNSTTVTLTSATPNPQLPYILPNPSLGIVNAKVVKAHGGTTTTGDKAEQYLNQHSQGSGPYMLESYNPQSQLVFTANPHYAGTKPTYSRIVLQNVDASTQKVNLQAGSAQVAFSLGSDQIKGMDTSKTKVVAGQSTDTIFMWFNLSPPYGKTAANVKFVQAMRHAINYKTLLGIAGPGSKQPGGMVPLSFLGALTSDPNNTYNPTMAKSLLAKSGYKGAPVSILYSDDVAIGGVKMGDVAQAIQSQVKAIGVNLKLNPQPSATSLDAFRSGKAQGGVAYWGADYPDPADYLVFAPGQSLGLRAAWTAAAAPTSAKLATAAAAASGNGNRAAAYIALQKQLNVEGPFIPLFQPPSNTVLSTNLKNVQINPIWNLDFSALS